MFVKKSVNLITPYKVVPQEAWEHPDISLKLDWNEATIPVSEHVKDALIRAINTENLNWYPNIANTELKNKIASYVGTAPENIMYFASSDSAHEYIARTYLEAADRVLVVGPTYDNFRVTCQSESYDIRYYWLDEHLDADMDALAGTIKKIRPKLVYMCSPNNPTGTEYSYEEIRCLIEEYPAVLFLIDEAYIEFSELPSKKDLILDHENVILSRTFSKAFGLAGFRFGYVISHPDNLDNIGRIRNPKSITTLTQIAVKAALDNVQYMYEYVGQVKESKQYFIKQLDCMGIPYKAGGGNFTLAKIYRPKSYIDFLRIHRIYVRDYTHISNLHGYDCRITIGTKVQMERVADMTRQYLTRCGNE